MLVIANCATSAVIFVTFIEIQHRLGDILRDPCCLNLAILASAVFTWSAFLYWLVFWVVLIALVCCPYPPSAEAKGDAESGGIAKDMPQSVTETTNLRWKLILRKSPLRFSHITYEQDRITLSFCPKCYALGIQEDTQSPVAILTNFLLHHEAYHCPEASKSDTFVFYKRPCEIDWKDEGVQNLMSSKKDETRMTDDDSSNTQPAQGGNTTPTEDSSSSEFAIEESGQGRVAYYSVSSTDSENDAEGKTGSSISPMM